MEHQKQKHPVVTCDQECWVQDRIATAIRMAIDLHRARKVAADDPAFEYALAGVIEGTAIEVVRELGLEPCFVNLRNVQHRRLWPC